MKNKTGLILAGALGSLTNTVFVLGGIFYLFGNVFDGNIQKLLATVISTNSIAELVISAVLTLANCSKTTDFEKIKTISTFKLEGGDFALYSFFLVEIFTNLLTKKTTINPK